MAKFIIFRKIVDNEKILINIDSIRSMEPTSKLYNGDMVDCTDIYYLDNRVTVLSTIDEIYDIIESDWETNVWDTTGDIGDDSGDDSGGGDDGNPTILYSWLATEYQIPFGDQLPIMTPLNVYFSKNSNDRPDGWSTDDRRFVSAWGWDLNQNNISQDAETIFFYGRRYGTGQAPGLSAAEIFIFPDLESATNAYDSDDQVSPDSFYVRGIPPQSAPLNTITRVIQ